MLPGPDMLIVIRNSLRYGRLRGICTAFGVSTMMTTYCAIAVFFIAAIRSKYIFVFKFVSSFGALYLLYLAFMCWYNAKKFSFQKKMQVDAGETIPLLKAYFLGAVTNLSNPKAVIYFISIMPFFVQRASGLVMHIVITVGLACLCWFLFVSYILAIQKVREKFSKASIYMEYIFAVVLLIFGIWVLSENLFT